MAITILAPTSESVVRFAWPVIVQVKDTWSDDWRWVPEMQMVSARWSSGGHDLSDATFRRFFGESIKMPWESALNAKTPWNGGYNVWVRVAMVGNGGYTVVWIGRISGEGRNVWGGATGDQVWQAYGPTELLRKIYVSDSYWLEGAAVNELGWVPHFNHRWNETVTGNRSGAKQGGTYVFGGTDAWSHHDILEYLILRFVDESDDGGPAWGMAGSEDVMTCLKELKEPVSMSATQTVGDMLRRLIPVEVGLDYTILPVESGFVIWVYSLTPYSWQCGDKVHPRNTDQVQIRAAASVDSDGTRISWDGSRTFGRIRVLGNRLVCCCSLFGATWDGSLEAKWEADLEAGYKAGGYAEGELGKTYDKVRKQDKFRAVYQMFGAPADWDYDDGAALPQFDAITGEDTGELAAYQNTMRETLPWLPIRENVDYTADPAEDNNPTGHNAELIKPKVWIADAHPKYPFNEDIIFFTPLDTHGYGISVAKQGLGILVSCPYMNHSLGKNHFDSGSQAASEHTVIFDYDKLVATIAFRTDWRIALVLEAPDWKPSDGTVDIVVDDAEFWYFAKQTVVNVDSSGCLEYASESTRVIRNDLPKLHQIMAGTLSRYYASRCRAELQFKGLLPWPLLVGRILTVLQTAGDTYNLAAPITSVSWTNPSGQDQPSSTTIHAGFARG